MIRICVPLKVTVPSFMMIASIVSEESFSGDTHTPTHTCIHLHTHLHTPTHTHKVWSSVMVFKVAYDFQNKQGTLRVRCVREHLICTQHTFKFGSVQNTLHLGPCSLQVLALSGCKGIYYMVVWVVSIQTSSFISHFTGEIVAHTVASGQTLRCYDCMDTFKETWTPYTTCQANVTAVPVATCLESDQYCKVSGLPTPPVWPFSWPILLALLMAVPVGHRHGRSCSHLPRVGPVLQGNWTPHATCLALLMDVPVGPSRGRSFWPFSWPFLLANITAVPVATCLESDQYCKVSGLPTPPVWPFSWPFLLALLMAVPVGQRHGRSCGHLPRVGPVLQGKWTPHATCWPFSWPFLLVNVAAVPVATCLEVRPVLQGKWTPHATCWPFSWTFLLALLMAVPVATCLEVGPVLQGMWTPHTTCLVTAVPKATCLESDQYCKVSGLPKPPARPTSRPFLWPPVWKSDQYCKVSGVHIPPALSQPFL